jgi:hypothetical protein
MKVNQPHDLTTVQFSAQIGIKPESIRVRLCQTGSYFGVTPRKLPNGRLLWPADATEQLLGKEGAA